MDSYYSRQYGMIISEFSLILIYVWLGSKSNTKKIRFWTFCDMVGALLESVGPIFSTCNPLHPGHRKPKAFT